MKARLRSWSSTFQKIRQVKRTEIIVMAFDAKKKILKDREKM